jgi:hypothetical protein
VYAQLVRCHSSGTQRIGLHQLVADQLIPALQHEPGFAGALSLGDEHSEAAIVIMLWTSAEQANTPLGERGATVSAALSHIVANSNGGRPPISVWEVTIRV